MTLKLTKTAFLAAAGQRIPLQSLLSPSAGGNPAYLVVSALDRAEYTVGASGATGTFAGDGRTLALAGIGGDGRAAGIVYQWRSATHSYWNATYGSLSQLDFTAAGSAGDITSLSFYGAASAAVAQAAAADPFALMLSDATGYLGSLTVAETAKPRPAPTQATPRSIAAAAQSLVGQAWNDQGCWVLASTIAARAGAGLPVQSTAVGLPGAANGEWMVLFNGPAGSSGDWQNMVSAGDIVVFATSATSGHITTCVAGSGASAQLVDNITYIGANGQIANSGHDGSANDVLIAPPHPAAQEFAGVPAGSVVIYALDTPRVTSTVTRETLLAGGSVTLGAIAGAADPAGKTIAAYQIYETSGAATLLVGGVPTSHGTAADPLSVTSLATVSLLAGAAGGTGTLEIRASNGAYWGDWHGISVSVAAAAGGMHLAW